MCAKAYPYGWDDQPIIQSNVRAFPRGWHDDPIIKTDGHCRSIETVI